MRYLMKLRQQYGLVSPCCAAILALLLFVCAGLSGADGSGETASDVAVTAR